MECKFLFIKMHFDRKEDRKMKFDKISFKKNAEHVIRKRVPESHLDRLNGKPVTDDEIKYIVGGKSYSLCPVLKEWCKER